MRARIVRNAKQVFRNSENKGFTEKLKQLKVGDALLVEWDRVKHPSLKSSARTLAKRQGMKVSAREVSETHIQIYREA